MHSGLNFVLPRLEPSRLESSFLKHLALSLLCLAGSVGSLLGADPPNVEISSSSDAGRREASRDGASVPSQRQAASHDAESIFHRFNQEKHDRNGPGINRLISASVTISNARRVKTISDNSDRDRTLIFVDDFEGRTTLGDEYTNSDTTGKAWTIKDGVLFANQVNPKHGCVMRKPMKFNDLDVEFDFRFNGGRSFNFVVDDQKENSVHAGHICRVSVFRKGIAIVDDKTGAMNLKVRAQRKDPDLPKAKQVALERLLERTRINAKAKIEPERWHNLRVQIERNIMRAILDGKQVAELKSRGFSHRNKTQFGMTVNGTTIDFDNLKVYKTSGR